MRTLLTLMLAALMILPTEKGNARILASCPNLICLYFPFISRPMPVVIVEALDSSTRASTYTAVGTVANLTNTPVYNVIIETRLYNASNQLLNTSSRATVFTATLPGQLNPYEINTSIRFDQVARKEISITGFSLVSTQTFISPTVTFTPPITQGGVIGEIRNPTTATLTNLRIAVWYSACNVIEGDIADNVSPGQIITFTRPGCASDQPPVWPQLKFAVQGVAVP